MLSQAGPYSAYRDSGLRWLGKLPAHWDFRRAKFFLREVDERSTTGNEEMLSVSHKTGVTPRSQKSVTMFLAESNVGHKVAMPGDVVVNTMWAWMAALGVSSRDGIVSPSYGVYRPRRAGTFDPAFLDALLRTPAYRAEYATRSTGITDSRLRLYADEFLSIPIPHPPMDEQLAIARCVAYVNWQAREFVEAKNALINRLEEQQLAVINRATTSGLNPSVELKPSGVNGLGDIPLHWELTKLGRLGTFLKGDGGTKEDEVSEGIPCVRYGDLYTTHDFTISAARSCVSAQRAADYTPIEHGDVLFAGSGETLEQIGKSAVSLLTSPACCGGDVLIFRSRRDVSPSFLGYATDCGQARDQKSRMGRGVTIMHLYSRDLKHLWLALPPLDEQEAIAQLLDQRTAETAAAIDRIRSEVSLLNEYRDRLVADVLTGKLDVRGIAASLSEPPTDLESAVGRRSAESGSQARGAQAAAGVPA